jgi:hypothetical protein
MMHLSFEQVNQLSMRARLPFILLKKWLGRLTTSEAWVVKKKRGAEVKRRQRRLRTRTTPVAEFLLFSFNIKYDEIFRLSVGKARVVIERNGMGFFNEWNGAIGGSFI